MVRDFTVNIARAVRKSFHQWMFFRKEKAELYKIHKQNTENSGNTFYISPKRGFFAGQHTPHPFQS